MQSQCPVYTQSIIYISSHSCTVMRKKYVIPLFRLIRYLILLQMAWYFSGPNGTKYIVPP